MSSRSTPPGVTGTLRVHYRGFGFVESDAGSVFVPASKLKGFLDGDVVTARVVPGGDQAQRLTLVTRTRTVVAGEVVAVRGQLHLKVDEATGSLSLPLTGDAPAGSSLIASLNGSSCTPVEQLGSPLDPIVLARRAMVRHQLPWAYPQDAVDEAARLAKQAPTRTAGRRDLTDQLVITIDDDHSQDLDDAVSALPARNGSVRVWVHIADVAEHVIPGSALDRAAVESATSVYLPTGVRHMLPGELATAQLSLLPGVNRDVLTVELLIDAEGSVSSVDVYESTIHSRCRVNYATVGRVITTGSADGVPADVTSLVSILWAAASKLGVARSARGGLDAYRSDPEPAGTTGTDDAHLLIERLMVAANEAVATWLGARDMPALYRVHPGIRDADAGDLEAAAASLGLYPALPRPVTPKAMAALAAAASRTVHADAFWDSVFRVLGRASYSPTPALHFGLGSDAYLHFTSPLRRYADLVVHRMVKAYLRGERDVDVDLTDLAAVVTTRSGSADAAERDVKRALAISALKPGMKVRGTVLSVTDRGARVMVESVIVNLNGERVRVDETLDLVVSKADALTGRLEVRPAGATARSTGSGRATTSRTSREPRAAKPAASVAAPEVAPVTTAPERALASSRPPRRRKAAASAPKTSDTPAPVTAPAEAPASRRRRRSRPSPASA